MNINNEGAAILAANHGDVWAMEPNRFAALTHRVASGQRHDKPKCEAVKMNSGGKGSIAVIPIMGCLTSRDYWYGDTSYKSILENLHTAISWAPSRIVYVIDSCGGEANGIVELTEAMRAYRDVIPSTAVVDTEAYSAAFWLASQATEIVTVPTGQVGSIGVWTMHVDASKMLEQGGQQVTLIYAGKYKVEGHPYGPLEREAHANVQSRIDWWYDKFLTDVAKGRRTQKNIVKAHWGKGRTIRTEDALRLKMIDRVATCDDVIREVRNANRNARQRAARQAKIDLMLEKASARIT